MIIFLVPVKSKKLSNDWPLFCLLFERTIRSICNQENPQFKVIVASHEIPEINFKNENIVYTQVTFDPPTLVEGDWDKNRELKEGDKANKILAAYDKAISFKPEYLMVVDADDCISNKITSFVASQPVNSAGWYIDQGYYYKEGAKYLFLNKKTFNNLCGSCIIIRTDLFPQLIITEPWLYYFHELRELPDGTKLMPLPFAGALYSMANGENHFMSVQHAINLIKKPKFNGGKYFVNLYEKILKYRIRFISNKFKKTFNFYNV